MASKFVGRVSPPPNLGAHICLVRIERGDGGAFSNSVGPVATFQNAFAVCLKIGFLKAPIF